MFSQSKKRIVIFGQIGSGKTAILKRYIDNQFTEEHEKRIGVNFVFTDDFKIWEMEGKLANFDSSSDTYLQPAQHIIYVIPYNTQINSLITEVENIKSLSVRFPAARLHFMISKCDLDLGVALWCKDQLQKELNKFKIVGKIYVSSSKRDINIQSPFAAILFKEEKNLNQLEEKEKNAEDDKKKIYTKKHASSCCCLPWFSKNPSQTSAQSPAAVSVNYIELNSKLARN